MESSSRPDIAALVLEAKERKVQSYPQHTNRASDCGHACERYLVLSRTRWEERALHDGATEILFEGGRMIEDMAVRDLQEAGFQVLEQQRPFHWPAYELTGHLDLKIMGNGLAKPVPVEIKGLNHQDSTKLRTLSDFLNSSKPWIRKYPAQLTMYCLNTESDLGLFYIKDKLNYYPKAVWLDLDYDYAESICQKLARVNAHVAAGTLPSPINDYSWCERCPFMHICLPEIKAGADLEFIEDDALLELLERRWQLAESASEYAALDKQVKKSFEGREKVSIGDFLIQSKVVQRQEYTVEAGSYWRTTITKVGEPK